MSDDTKPKPAKGKGKAKPKAAPKPTNGAKPAESNGSKPRGRWQKGQSGNPAGRKPGVQNTLARLVRERLEERAQDILTALIEKACIGNTDALELALNRMSPPVKRHEVQPYAIGPLSTVAECDAEMRRLAHATAIGEIDAEHSRAIAERIRDVVSLQRTSEIATRLEELERAYQDKLAELDRRTH